MATQGTTLPRPAGTTANPPTSDHNSDIACPNAGHEEQLTERHFLIPIKDSHGHSERISLRVNPAYMPVLNNILRSGKFPFRSTNDIVRYAIDRICRDLERRAEIPSMMRRIDAIREIFMHEEYQSGLVADIERMTYTVQSYVNAGAINEAARVVAETRHQIQSMPEGYWRTRYEQELLTRFGHLLKVEAGTGASLTDGDEQ